MKKYKMPLAVLFKLQPTTHKLQYAFGAFPHLGIKCRAQADRGCLLIKIHRREWKINKAVKKISARSTDGT